jgi:ketosteroid isomerase-like protein
MSADQLAELYREDAVHELPFTKGPRAVLRGREEVRRRYAEVWSSSPVKVEDVHVLAVLAVHAATSAVVAELVLQLSAPGVPNFTAGNVLVMQTVGGRLFRVRDYVDNEAILRGLGRLPAL